MKSINIKKAATVIAGTALLAGAAFAAVDVPTDAADPDFYWGTDKSVTPKIVIGQKAAASDGVQAAKLAAFLASKAWKGGGETLEILPSEIDVDCSVTVEVSGDDSVDMPEESVWEDLAWSENLTSADKLVLTSTEGLYQGEALFEEEEYQYEESVVAGEDTILIKYAEDEDYHGVYFDDVKGDKFYYKLDFIDNFPVVTMTETVPLIFLGEEYVINDVDTNKIELVKGQKLEMGGAGEAFAQTVEVDGETYTVTMTDIQFSEQTGIGSVTIQVVKESTQESEAKKIQNGKDAVVAGLTVYVQSSEKSYDIGKLGTATLRVGGAVLELEDNEAFPLDSDWEVELGTTTTGLCPSGLTCTDYIDYIQLNYDLDIEAEDETTVLEGPAEAGEEPYFWLEYLKTQIDGEWDSWRTEEITIEADQDDDAYLDAVTYTSETTKKEYTTPLINEDGETERVFLATGGAINNLTEEDVFFVDYVPVYIQSIRSDDDYTDSEVTFTYGKGATDSDNEISQTIKGEGCTENAATGTVTCTASQSVENAPKLNIGIVWTYNDTMYPDDDDLYLNITSGADNSIMTKYAEIDWTSGGGIGPTTITVTDVAGDDFTVYFDDTGDDKGILVNDTNGEVIEQNNDDRSDDEYTFHYAEGAWIEATSSDTVVFTIPEQDGLKKRVSLTKSRITIEGGEAGQRIYTPANFNSPVLNFTCEALPVSKDITTGVVFGNVPSDLVTLDTANPTTAVVIGGHMVNNKAQGTTGLTAAGQTYVAKEGSVVYVAGYSAADTASAVDALIAAIKAAMAA